MQYHRSDGYLLAEIMNSVSSTVENLCALKNVKVLFLSKPKSINFPCCFFQGCESHTVGGRSARSGVHQQCFTPEDRLCQ